MKRIIAFTLLALFLSSLGYGQTYKYMQIDYLLDEVENKATIVVTVDGGMITSSKDTADTAAENMFLATAKIMNISGQKIDNEKQYTFIDFLNTLGKSRWQIINVGIENLPDGVSKEYLLMRVDE